MKPICITFKANCHNAGTTSKIVDCSQYKPWRILTNADRIRSMSDEELAEHIWKKIGCPAGRNYVTCGYAGSCKDCWVDWLQQPAEENPDGH